MSDEKKQNLFDKLKSAVDQVLPGQGGASADGKKRPTQKGGLADRFKLTDRLTKPKTTGQLAEGKSTARLQHNGPTDEQLSPRRLAMIDDYMRGEAKIEQMNDPAYMYKIVSDERAYQTRLLMEFRKQYSQLGKTSGQQAEALQAKIKRSQAIVQNLFKVLKRITGKQGHTGGTDFLSDK